MVDERQMANKTEQEAFWMGDFGNDYTGRNKTSSGVAKNIAFFSRVLDRTQGIQKVLELGSNIGYNLLALRQLLPDVTLSAVELNEKAASELKQNLPDINLYQKSILEFKPTDTWDLVFTKGVLIHINPDYLSTVYDVMYESSLRYVLVCEYYYPTPMEVIYRGHSGKLFKRDFAGEMLEIYSDLSLIDYGFVYHRGTIFPQDDMTWFLMEKVGKREFNSRSTSKGSESLTAEDRKPWLRAGKHHARNQCAWAV